MRREKGKREGGFLTVDFLLAIVATISCMLFLLRLSLSFVTVELAQYVLYATARAQAAGDVSSDEQKIAGEEKYKKLLKTPEIAAGFLRPGSTISKNVTIGDLSNYYAPSGVNDGTNEMGLPMWGARSELTIKQAEFVAFLGRAANTNDEYKAGVNGIIFREPSSEECRRFFKEINPFQLLVDRDGSGRFRRAQSAGSPSYVPMEDSGC